jgi:hypothetical protein
MPMSDEMESGPLSIAEARRLINQWSRGGFFRVRDLGSRVTIEEITPRSSYMVTLQSQYEDRTVEPAFAPFRGEVLDDRGEPPDVWDIAVRPPAAFEERTERLTVPHTDRVEACKSCWGAGHITCTQCNGMGKVNCPLCHGTGTKQVTETRTQTNAQGGLETVPVQVQVACTCFGGRVNCGQCNGAGRDAADSNAGSRSADFAAASAITGNCVGKDAAAFSATSDSEGEHAGDPLSLWCGGAETPLDLWERFARLCTGRTVGMDQIGCHPGGGRGTCRTNCHLRTLIE